MKLNDIRPTIETSGELEEQFFSIQDQGMIFDILRNKMYSNPILAICREISCNARDAHREVGNSDLPIEIYLPNNLQPIYKIRDFGPGISPDRMSNIFIKYTASTKRLDNIQTGGFGLGCKTPFSYSDTFNIKTVHNGIEYNYACFIDETKVGKLILLSEAPSKEINGTEIIVPVKPNDFRTFNQWTEHSTRYWKVKPTIKGGTITWQEQKKILEGINWEIISNPNNYYGNSSKLIIDGIEYPLDINALKTYADSTLIDSIRGELHMHFNIGELSLSANREQIYLDKQTQAKISQHLDSVVLEIKKNVQKKIDEFSNLWEANIFYRTDLAPTFNNLTFLNKSGKLNWQGIELHSGYLSAGCRVFTFTKGKYSRKNGTDPDKLTRTIRDSIEFVESSSLYINDLPIKDPTPRHVKKAFEDNVKLKSLQVICITDKITVDSLNKSLSLDKMNPSMLSSITKASSRAYTPAASRLLIFKFDSKANMFRQVSYASIDEDANDKVLCMLSRDGYEGIRETQLKNKNILSHKSINSILTKFPKTSFYGVDLEIAATRIKGELSDFESIEDFLKEKVTNNKLINFIEIKFANKYIHNTDERFIKNYPKIKLLIDDPQSLFIKRGELQLKIRNIYAGDLGLLHIYETINGEIALEKLTNFLKNNPEYDIDKINKDYNDKYQILQHISVWEYGNIAKHLAHYINLIDKV